ncbi:CHAT domain-containing protein [Micromonospora sp. DT201]|uniref:CHAT domain-containing protein n=1 Tax=Micromonospora sp. DT201 TaxID=3393442 RepID=UPI003CF1D343
MNHRVRRHQPADEAIHIASALQTAGFPHVIGTLWPIPDHVAPQFAHHHPHGQARTTPTTTRRSDQRVPPGSLSRSSKHQVTAVERGSGYPARYRAIAAAAASSSS